MDRAKKVLRESAIILGTGVMTALAIVGVIRFYDRPTIEQFQQEYAGKGLQTQVAVADRYLDFFSPQELNAAIEAENAEGFCHSQAHALGRATYERFPNLSDAIRQCGTACTFGCFHGVLMQMFQTDSDTLGGLVEEETPEGYIAQIQTIAADLCDRPEVASEVKARYCYHGLGHVFAYFSGTDLDKGLASCNIYPDAYAGLYCRSGVFMEYLFSTSSARLLYSKGPEPCDAYPEYTNKCFRYKAYGWISVWGSLPAALKACDSFGDTMLMCISNTAEAAATPALLAAENGMQEMCGSLIGSKHDACLDGAMMKIIDLNNGDDSEHVCDIVAPEHRARCLRVRSQYEADMFFELNRENPELGHR